MGKLGDTPFFEVFPILDGFFDVFPLRRFGPPKEEEEDERLIFFHRSRSGSLGHNQSLVRKFHRDSVWGGGWLSAGT
jgi:hypothetical protein